MTQCSRLAPAAALALILAAGASLAEPQHGGDGRGGGERGGGHMAAPRQGEAHPGPSGYQRLTEPQGWNSRPGGQVDRGAYQHNYQAARAYHIGPYHPPMGYAPRRWAYGMILPRAFWSAPYLIADYWLFALEVPPAGYEWVRVGPDAVLVNVYTGEVLQVEYGVFA